MDDVNPLFHVMADVIAKSWYCDSHYYLVRQMLLPYNLVWADVIALWLM